MKTEIDTRADLRPHFDGRDYALMVTVRADTGLVEVQHQTGADDVADRQMARLAAEIIDEVGAAAVDAQRTDGIRLQRPARGVAVLACRCGRAIDLDQMHRQRRRPTQSPAVIQPIVCVRCAS